LVIQDLLVCANICAITVWRRAQLEIEWVKLAFDSWEVRDRAISENEVFECPFAFNIVR
jgi:hypothetical protein